MLLRVDWIGAALSLDQPSCPTYAEDKEDDDGMIVVIKEEDDEEEKTVKTFTENVTSKISPLSDFRYNPSRSSHINKMA